MRMAYETEAKRIWKSRAFLPQSKLIWRRMQCSYIPRVTLESGVGLLRACKCIVTLADRGRKEGEVTKSDALLRLLLLRISANRARERRNAEPTAMQVANRFFARRNSRGVTSWLASPAAGPGGRGRTVTVCQTRRGGRFLGGREVLHL